MKRIAHLAFVLPLLLTSCQAADTPDKALNEALKKGLLASPALANVPLEIAEVAIPWDATPSDASGRFSVKAKTTEGFYKAVDPAAGLQKLEITDLHENELNAAAEKIDSLPMSYRTNLRNVLAAASLNLPRFYDVFVSKGGEVTIRGSVKMVKFGDEDWQIEELQVNPLIVGNAPLGNDYTPESKLQATEYRLDDSKTKEAVHAVIQNRKDFVAKVESAGSEWQKEQGELNVILKKALDGREEFSALPMEITEVTGNWTEKSSGDASGTFTLKGKATEGLYKAVKTLDGLQKLDMMPPGGGIPDGAMMAPGGPMIEPLIPKADDLFQEGKISYEELQRQIQSRDGGITNLFEREFAEAKDKMGCLPEAQINDLRNMMPQDRLDWQFYDVVIPQGGEINVTGAVKLVKYGNDDWEMDEIMVNPVDLVANSLIPESQLREGLRLDDAKTKETVSAVVQKRKDFVDRVDAAVGAWVQQQQREAVEAERKRVEEERIAKEKRKAERVALKKSAVEDGNAYYARKGFENSWDSDKMGNTVAYGTAVLKQELSVAAGKLRNKGPFDDEKPLQEEVEKVRVKIGEEREKIAKDAFYKIPGWSGSNLSVDLDGDKASFTLTSNIGYTIAGFLPEIVEEITLPASGLAVRMGNIRGTYIELHISGNVTAIREIWDNGKNYQVKVWFNNARHQEQKVPWAVDASTYQSVVRVNMFGIDIIDTRVRQPVAVSSVPSVQREQTPAQAEAVVPSVQAQPDSTAQQPEGDRPVLRAIGREVLRQGLGRIPF